MTAKLALAISFLSFCVSALSFYRGSTWAQNRRTKREKMRLVVARSVLVWVQMQNLIVAKIGGYQLDPYFFPSYQRNIHRLEDAIDNAVAVGLFGDLVGSQEHALSLHTAFIQCLAHMETLSPESAELDDWIKQHFTMGIIRLLDRCIRLHPYTLPTKLRNRLLQRLSGIRDKASSYIHSAAP